MAEEKPKEEKERYVVQNIPTQTQPMIVDRKTEEVYTIEIALVKILNKLEIIEQSVG